MSTPAENADTLEELDDNSSPSFVDRVNEAVEGMKKDAKGSWTLPEDTPEEIRFAAIAERRRRDTQAEYTRISQENKALKAEKSVLLTKALSTAKLELTAEQEEELEDLKFSDPEAWRKKMNVLEAEALNKRKTEVDEEVKKVSTSSLEAEEVERRKQVLTEFLEEHEGFELDDDIIANDIPPRITKKLESGAISFEQFLEECYNYTKTGKVVKQDRAPTDLGLGKAGGGGRPDNHAVQEDIIRSYSKETF